MQSPSNNIRSNGVNYKFVVFIRQSFYAFLYYMVTILILDALSHNSHKFFGKSNLVCIIGTFKGFLHNSAAISMVWEFNNTAKKLLNDRMPLSVVTKFNYFLDHVVAEYISD